MRGRTWAVCLAVAGVIAAIAVWIYERPRHVQRIVKSHRVDTAAVVAQFGARIEAAKRAAVRHPAVSSADKKWPMQGMGKISLAEGIKLVEPSCVLGPGELCEIVKPLIESCDAGDARDCLAVGQFLTDAPPYPLIAVIFFTQACRIGDAEGCERYYALKDDSLMTCASDPFACGYRAMLDGAPEAFDEACSVGVADACSMMTAFTRDDPDQTRAYLEASCQFGSPMACDQLGHSLRADCVPADLKPCYPPDATQSAALLAIACGAGWTDACGDGRN